MVNNAGSPHGRRQQAALEEANWLCPTWLLTTGLKLLFR
jgi:hypothetical protein